jgi:hypothetical protein
LNKLKIEAKTELQFDDILFIGERQIKKEEFYKKKKVQDKPFFLFQVSFRKGVLILYC